MANRLTKLAQINYTPASPYIPAQEAYCVAEQYACVQRPVYFGEAAPIDWSNPSGEMLLGGMVVVGYETVCRVREVCFPYVPAVPAVPASINYGTIAGWNGGGRSREALDGDGYFRFNVSHNPSAVVVGLSADDASTLPSEPTHAFYVHGDVVEVMESGEVVATAPTAHVMAKPLTITRTGEFVTYQYDGWSYSSAQPIYGTVQYLDAAIYASGDFVDNPQRGVVGAGGTVLSAVATIGAGMVSWVPAGVSPQPGGGFNLGDGTGVGPDGTVTLPGGTTVTPDGTVTLPDGTVVGADGTVTTENGVVVSPDGTVSIPGTGGTVVVAPDGTTTLPDGTIIHPDGSITLPNGGGSVAPGTETTLPDGTVVGVDGSVTLPSGEVIAPNDGGITLPDSTVVAPDGTVTLPDGTAVSPDGTVTMPDGTVVAPDGTVTLPGDTTISAGGVTTLPDGTTVAPDGTVTFPDGTVVAPDGTTTLPGGTVVSVNPTPSEWRQGGVTLSRLQLLGSALAGGVSQGGVTLPRTLLRGADNDDGSGGMLLPQLELYALGGHPVPQLLYGLVGMPPLHVGGRALTGTVGTGGVVLPRALLRGANFDGAQGGATLRPLYITGLRRASTPEDVGHALSTMVVGGFFATVQAKHAVLMDGLVVQDSYLLRMSVSESWFELLNLQDTVTPRRLLSAIAQSGLLLSTDSVTGHAEMQYAVNVLTGGLTNYDGFAFKQFARTPDKVYAVRNDGLYVLRPGDDNGSPMDVYVDFGETGYGSSKTKTVDTIYLGLNTDGEVIVTLKSDGTERVYRAVERDSVMRVTAARGASGRRWNMTLQVVDATELELDNIEQLVAVSTNRRAR